MPGLESKYLKQANGDFKKGWALQRAAQGNRPARHAKPRTFTETVVPTTGGGGITSRSMGGLCSGPSRTPLGRRSEFHIVNHGNRRTPCHAKAKWWSC